MFLISICLLAGNPCQDQIRYGLFDTREECIQAMETVKIKNRIAKYKGRAVGKCVEIWTTKLTEK